MARSRRRIRNVRQLRDAAEAPRGPRAAAARGQGDAKLFQEPHDVTREGLGGISAGKLMKTEGFQQEFEVISENFWISQGKTYRDAWCRFKMI